MKKALITGITGQDGSYLSEFLLSKGYEVHGIIRRASSFNTQRVDHLYADPHETSSRFFLHYGDLSDAGCLHDIISDVMPDEVYHLGAQSHVKVSFQMPEFTANVTGLGTLRLLETLRRCAPNARFYQASSSEMFGSQGAPQNEKTLFYPRSPYAAAKVYAYWITVNYREAYGLFACNGILFNHESPRRGETFVTRKVTRALANILAGTQKTLYLGNLNAKRDWGFAPEYVEMMWLMLQQNTPNDYVVGTGQSHTIREFIEAAFAYVGIEIGWEGDGVDERGVVKNVCLLGGSPRGNALDVFLKQDVPFVAQVASDDKPSCTAQEPACKLLKNVHIGDTLIKIDPHYFRPTEVDHLQADITKAKELLCWQPRVTFHELIKIMVDYDLKLVGLEPVGDGIAIGQQKDFTYTSHAVTWMYHEHENCI